MDRVPPPIVAERWRELVDDAEATVAEYEQDGWETFLVHPGDVTPITGDPFGLDLLAPGNEFDALQELVSEVDFHTSHVYHSEEGGVRFLVVVVEGTKNATDVAVVLPAYLAADQTGELKAQATEAGVIYTHVRPLSDDARVTFTHEDPDLFF